MLSKGNILIIDAGYFLVRELVNAARANGLNAVVLRLPLNSDGAPPEAMQYSQFLRDLVSACQRFQPQALLTINHLGFDSTGYLTGLLDKLRLPSLIWYVDSPRYILQDAAGNISPRTGIFVWDRSYIPWLQQIGFSHVHYLPLATDPEVYYEARDVLGEADSFPCLIFVGDSLAQTLQKALDKVPAELKVEGQAKNASVLHVLSERLCKIAFNGGWSAHRPAWDILPELMQGEVRSHWEGLPEQIQRNMESALTLLATRQRRTEFIQKLAEAYPSPNQITIYGDAGWAEAVSQNNGINTINLLPAVDYYRELPRVYGAAGAVLNLTSLQMPQGLNQRCYDVPAAGGFLLTDAQPALAEQFDLQSEVVSFRSLEEMREKWNYYRDKPEQRRQIALNGQKRVLGEHTYKLRLQEMLKMAQTWFA